MSSTIDQRIVEMKFDNDEFEKGVAVTMKTLDNLEKKLQLKEGQDGFDRVSKAAATMQLGNIDSQLSEITNKFSLLGDIGYQAIHRISNAVLDMGERLIKSFTVDPIMEGFWEYETKVGSVQSILAGVRDKYADDATAIDAITAALDDMNDYADKTIYKFTDMTTNLGKFVQQTQDLEGSADAIKGVFNWAAYVGADKNQASHAIYNISQAYGEGAMLLRDWRSIVMAGMADKNTRNLAMLVGQRLGEVGADGKVQVSKKQRVSVVDDFQESLKARWMTDEVMTELLQIYSGEFTVEDWVKKGYSQELAEYFVYIGQSAAEAATQARTFSQAMDSLKEAAGSGWAQSFDIIFGGFEGSKWFWTSFKAPLEELIGGISDMRNGWLENIAAFGGNTQALEGVINVLEVFKELTLGVATAIGKIIDPFPEIENLVDVTGTWVADYESGVAGAPRAIATALTEINEALTGFRMWFTGEISFFGGRSPLANIQNIVSAISSGVMIIWNVLYETGRFGLKVFGELFPIIEPILGIFGDIGRDVVSIYRTIMQSGAIPKFFDSLFESVQPALAAFRDFVGVGLTLIREFLGFGQLSQIKSNAIFKQVGDFFSNLPETVKTGADKVKNFFEKLKKGFKSTGKVLVVKAVSPVKKLRNTVMEFFKNAFGEESKENVRKWFDESFIPTFGGVYNWVATTASTVKGKFVKAFEKVKSVIANIPKGIEAFNKVKYDQSLNRLQNFSNKMSALVYAIFDKETADKIRDAWNNNVYPAIMEIVNWFDANVTPTIDKITGFATKLGDAFTAAAGSKDTTLAGRISAFMMTLTDNATFTLPDWVNDFSKSVEEWKQKYGSDSFFGFVANWWNGRDVADDGGNVIEHYEGVAEQINELWTTKVQPIVTKISDMGTSLYEQISHALFGYDEIHRDSSLHNYESIEHHAGFIERISKFWEETVKPNFEKFSEEATAFWEAHVQPVIDKISDTLFGYNDEKTNEHHTGVFENIGKFWEESLEPTFAKIVNWINTEGAEAFAKIEKFYHTCVEPVITFLTDVGSKLFEGVLGFFTADVPEGTGFFDGLLIRLQSFEPLVAYFRDKITGWLDELNLGDLINNSGVGQWISTNLLGGQSVTGFTGGIFGGIGSTVNNIFTSLFGGGSPEEAEKSAKQTVDEISKRGIYGELIGSYADRMIVELQKQSGTAAEIADAAKIVQKEDKGFFGDLADSVLSIFFGTASAEGLNETVDAAAQTKNNYDELKKKLPSGADDWNISLGAILEPIGGLLGSMFGDLKSAAGVIALIVTLNRSTQLVKMLSGTEHHNFLTDIAAIIEAIGKLMLDVAVLVAVVEGTDLIETTNSLKNGTEKMSALDAAMEKLKDLLITVFAWVGGIAGGGTLLDFATSMGGNAIMAKLGDKFPGFETKAKNVKLTSFLETFSAIGTGFNGIFSGLHMFLEDIQLLFGEQLFFNGVDLVVRQAEDIISGGEKTESIISAGGTFESLITKVTEVISKIISGIIVPVLELTAGDTLVEGGLGLGVGYLGKKLDSEHPLDVELTSITDIMGSLGTFIQAVGAAMPGIGAALIEFQLVDDVDKKLEQVNKIISSISGIINSISLLQLAWGAGNTVIAVIAKMAGSAALGTVAAKLLGAALAGVAGLAVIVSAFLAANSKTFNELEHNMFNLTPAIEAINTVMGLTNDEKIKEFGKMLYDLFGAFIISPDFVKLSDLQATTDRAKEIKKAAQALNSMAKTMSETLTLATDEVLGVPKKIFGALADDPETTYDFTNLVNNAQQVLNASSNLKLTASNFTEINADAQKHLDDVAFAQKYARALSILASTWNLIPDVNQNGLNLGAAANQVARALTLEDFSISPEGLINEIDPEKLKAYYRTMIAGLPEDDVITQLSGFAGSGGTALTAFSSGLTNLGTAIKEYGAMLKDSVNGKDFKDNAKFLEVINSLGGLPTDYKFVTDIGNNETLSKTGSGSPLDKFVTSLTNLGTAVGAYGEVLTKYKAAPWSENSKFLQDIAKLPGQLGKKEDNDGIWPFITDALGFKSKDIDLDDFALSMENLGSGIERFGAAFSNGGFNVSIFEQAVENLKTVASFNDALKQNGGVSVLWGLVSVNKEEDGLDNLGSNLSRLGAGIASFFNSMTSNGTKDPPDMTMFNSAIDFLKGIAEVAVILKDGIDADWAMRALVDMLTDSNLRTSLGEALNTFVSNLGLTGNDAQLEKAANVFDGLASMVQFANTVDNAKFELQVSNLERLAKVFATETNGSLYEEMNKVYTDFGNNTIAPKVTPVLVMDQLDAEMTKAFGSDWRNTFAINSQISQENVAETNIPNGTVFKMDSGDLTTITNAVSGVGTSVGRDVATVASSINGMRVVIDGKLMVGAIVADMDYALGKRVGRVRSSYSTSEMKNFRAVTADSSTP